MEAVSIKGPAVLSVYFFPFLLQRPVSISEYNIPLIAYSTIQGAPWSHYHCLRNSLPLQ